jgi:hypothetical protein
MEDYLLFLQAVYLLCLVAVCRPRLVMCIAVIFHLGPTSLENFSQTLSLGGGNDHKSYTSFLWPEDLFG